MFSLDISHININEFRRPALTFLENYKRTGVGYYTDAPKNSIDYKDYWNLQKNYCINGISIGNVRLTGEHYFYLNFCQISLKLSNKVNTAEELTTKKQRVDTAITFPDFWDSDWYYFNECKRAENLGLHMIVLKPRRRGYSYKNAAKCAHTYTFSKTMSNSLILAEDKKYSEETMRMAVSYLDFINRFTGFARQRQHINKPREIVQASYEEITPDGRKLVGGSMSRIMQYSTLNNPDVARGKDARTILFEEAGSMSNLKATYTVTRPTVESGTSVSGQIFVYGTGGDFSGGMVDFEEMFYDPDTYGFLAYNNMYDEGSNQSIGYFLPDSYSKEGFINKQGVSYYKEAEIAIIAERERLRRNTKDINIVDKMICENPLKPSEAMLKMGTNIYPKAEINRQISRIKGSKSLSTLGSTGYMEQTEIGIIFKPSTDVKPILNFPYKPDVDGEGCVIQYQPPYKFGNAVPPELYYITCLTPGEKVMTDKGLINVENVSFNEKLINKNGKLVDIVRLISHNVKNKNVYKIKMSNTFRTTTFTEEHPILSSKAVHKVNYKKYHEKYKFNENYWDLTYNFTKVKDLNVGDWIKVPNIYKKEIEFDANKIWGKSDWKKTKLLNNPLNEKDFWWLVGLWLGDGWCINNTYTTCISFNAKEKFYIDKFSQICNKILNRKATTNKESTGAIVGQLSSERLCNFLNTNFGKYASGKKIPEWVKYIKHEYKEQLLYGYLASDGCITQHTNKYISVEYVSINLELLEGIQDIALSLGLISNLTKMRNAGIHKFKNYISNTKVCYHLRFGHQDSLNLIKPIYNENDCKMSKFDLKNPKVTNLKQKTFIFFDDDFEYFNVRIKQIEKSNYTGKVYNFETDTHTFMCKFITTHNCDPYAMDKDKAKEITKRDSLGAAYVMKRINNFSKPYDLIVAEYVARPKFQDDFNRQLFLLAQYYNAKIVFENDRDGNIMSYARTNKLMGYLEEELTVYDSNDAPRKKLGRNYGVSMSNLEVKKQAVQYFRDWLLAPREKNEDGEHELNLHKIYSVPLLEEILKFSYDGNFDRHSAMLVGMLYKKELLLKPQVEQQERSIYDDPFFSGLRTKFGITD